MSDTEEIRAITRVLNAFYSYKSFAYQELVEPKKLKYSSLSKAEQEILPWFTNHIATLEHCIEQNSLFFQKMAITVAEEWGVSEISSPSSWEQPTVSDYLKVKATLKQLLREWSDEAIEERESTFGEIIKDLEEKYPDINSRSKIDLLIPGVGLGRLNFELVRRGFSVQGNDFSYFMLFLSNFVLNHTFISNNYDIYPFIHSSSNQQSRAHQTRPVYIPDVLPSKELQVFQSENPTIPVPDLMSITSGSFIDLYGPNDLQLSSSYSDDSNAKEFRKSNGDKFDFVITVFFIDTASNVLEYLKTIKHCLKPEGEWINFGPLLWHFEDADDSQKVVLEDGRVVEVPINGLELTHADLLEIVKSMFNVTSSTLVKDVKYGTDQKGLGRWVYDCQHWIAGNQK